MGGKEAYWGNDHIKITNSEHTLRCSDWPQYVLSLISFPMFETGACMHSKTNSNSYIELASSAAEYGEIFHEHASIFTSRRRVKYTHASEMSCHIPRRV